MLELPQRSPLKSLKAYNPHRSVESFISTDDEARAAEHPLSEPVFFDVDFGNGAIHHLTRCDGEDRLDNTAVRKSSFSSDDEYQPIRMKVPRRVSKPRQIQKPRHQVDAPLSPSGATLKSAGVDASDIALLNAGPTLCSHSHEPSTATSSSTLFSLASTSSSPTYLNYPTKGHHPFCLYDDCAPRTLPDTASPDSITGTRGLASLRRHGYNFDWSRFAVHTDAARGLSPADSAKPLQNPSRLKDLNSGPTAVTTTSRIEKIIKTLKRVK